MTINQAVSAVATWTLRDWADFATASGILIAIGLLVLTWRQARTGARASQGQFWLELEKMFASHDAVHIKLRPGGKWTKPGAGPKTVEEWAAVEDYMGLFEHTEFMLQRGLLDWQTFETIFSYRLPNIVHNTVIANAKLRDERDGWATFLRLMDRLHIPLPKK
jgi:hypothetical protein